MLSDKKINISRDVLFQEINGETVLLNLNNEHYYGLDEMGTRIWQLLHEQNNLQKIYNILLNEYDVTEKILENDMNEFINELIEGELITID